MNWLKRVIVNDEMMSLIEDCKCGFSADRLSPLYIAAYFAEN
jgi:hypothetical protein